MAVTHRVVELNDTTPVAVSITGNHAGRDITIQNTSNTESVYIGGEGVSTSSYGFKISPNSAWSAELYRENVIYAIASDTCSVAVLEMALESSN